MRPRRLLPVVIFILLLRAAGPAIASPTPPVESGTTPHVSPRNVILFIADGCGTACYTLAREYARATGGNPRLAVDPLFSGSVQTYSSSSRITDSAASGTAYASGIKTYNGAVGVDSLKRPVQTILEAAEARGMATGLVATSRITHATPAAFAAHVESRDMENEIAAQLVAQGIEILFGGGRRHFLSSEEGGQREDGRNLLDEARELGYQIVADREALLDGIHAPVLGLFATSDLAFTIDRDAAHQPSLAEMTDRAIELLAPKEEGFFLMVEGSRIDHAAHDNDAPAHVREVLAFDEAVEVAMAFARRNGETLIVGVSDHGTGGLTLGRRVEGDAYVWYPDPLADVSMSQGKMIDLIANDQQDPVVVMRAYAGIDSLTSAELMLLEQAGTDEGDLELAISTVVGLRAHIGWTSDAHTGEDVPLFSHGPGSERFVGNLDNTDVGRLLAEMLDVTLPHLQAE